MGILNVTLTPSSMGRYTNLSDVEASRIHDRGRCGRHRCWRRIQYEMGAAPVTESEELSQGACRRSHQAEVSYSLISRYQHALMRAYSLSVLK